MRTALLRASGAVLLSSTLLACGGDGERDAADTSPSAATPAAPMKVETDLSFRADVPRVDANRWASLVVPHEGEGLWLTPEARSALRLEPGSVTIVPGRGALKVASVTDARDHLVVEPAPLTLADVVQNGSLSLGGAVAFDEPFRDHAGDVYEKTPESAAAPKTWQGPKPGDGEKALFDGVKEMILDGWHVTKLAAKTKDGALRYEVKLDKTSGLFDATIELTGAVNGLSPTWKANVREQTLLESEFAAETVGESDIAWTLRAHQGGIGYQKLLFPGLTYKKQLWVGEVPIVVRAKVAAGVIIGISGAQTYTTGRYHFTYRTDGAVEYRNAAGEGTGHGDVETSIDPAQGSGATAPYAVGLIATLPKIDVGLGLDELFVVGGTFSNSVNVTIESAGAVALSPCSDVTAKATGKLGTMVQLGKGYDPETTALAATGLQLASGLLSTTVYERKRTRAVCLGK